jgi:PIN domain
MFNIAYLDTEVLYRNSWPSGSVELKVFLELAKETSLVVIIPEAAEMERKRQWIEEIDESFLALTTAGNKASAACNRWGLPDPMYGIVSDRLSLEQHFIKLSTALKERWAIQSASVADTPLRAVYEMAMQRRSPFEQKDGILVGFQDTVILLSAIQHVKSITGARGVFVSADRVFRKPDIKDLIQQENVAIEVLESLSNLIAMLREAIDPEKVWEVDTREAAASLTGRKPHIEKLLYDQVRLLNLPGGKVTRVELSEIRNVQTPPIAERRAGASRVLSFDAQLGLNLEERTILYSGVGGESTGFMSRGTSAGLDARIEVTTEWDGKQYRKFRDARIIAAALYRAILTKSEPDGGNGDARTPVPTPPPDLGIVTGAMQGSGVTHPT